MKFILQFVFFMTISICVFAQDEEDDVNGFKIKKKVAVSNTEGENIYDDGVTFIVFDKNKMIEFEKKFPSLSHTNASVKNAIRELRKLKFTDFKFPNQEFLFSTKCTDKPEAKDFEIAQVVINTALDSNSKFIKNNFGAALNLLYFYNCLPDQIQTKWYQELTGNYKINANMMALLREESFLFDQVITGIKQKDLTEVDMVFGGHNFNEIEKNEAENMKQVIMNTKEFKDNSMIESKKMMFELLNKVITGEWRLFVVEWE